MMVRKAVGLTALLLLSAALVAAAQVKTNPAKPQYSRAGRVLALQEAFRIDDSSGDFYLKYPGSLGFGKGGMILLADEKQLLTFDSEGKFIENILKVGEGPGEIKEFFDFVVDPGQMYIYDFMVRKLIVTDFSGKMLREARNPEQSFNEVLGYYKGKLVTTKTLSPQEHPGTGFYDLKKELFLVSPDLKQEKRINSFNVKWYYIKQGRSIGAKAFSHLRCAMGSEGKVYVSHTAEYLLKRIALESGQVEKAFSREYQRVKKRPKKLPARFQSRLKFPEIEFESDVESLHIYGDLLWVKTSTRDAEERPLIDVFDGDGNYLDNFYLPPGSIILNSGPGTLFLREEGEDGNPVVVKYKILDLK